MTHAHRLRMCFALVIPLALSAYHAHAEILSLSMTPDPTFVPRYDVSQPWIPATTEVVIDIGDTPYAEVDFYVQDATTWDGGSMNYGADNRGTPDIGLWIGDQPTTLGLTWVQVTPDEWMRGEIVGPSFTNGQTMSLIVRVRDAAALGTLKGVLINPADPTARARADEAAKSRTRRSPAGPDSRIPGQLPPAKIDERMQRPIEESVYDPTLTKDEKLDLLLRHYHSQGKYDGEDLSPVDRSTSWANIG